MANVAIQYQTRPIVRHQPYHTYDASGVLFRPRDYVGHGRFRKMIHWDLARDIPRDRLSGTFVRIGDHMTPYHVAYTSFVEYDDYVHLCALYELSPITTEEHSAIICQIRHHYQ